MGAPEANTTLIYGIHVRESANDGSDFTNAAADYRILFLGEDGLLHVKDSSGTVTDPFTAGGGSGQGLVDMARSKRTAGNVTCNNTNWTAVDTGTDLTMSCTAGDIIEVSLSAGAFGTEAVTLNLTAQTVPGGTPTNDIATDTAVSNTTNGVGAWRVASSASGNIGGTVQYVSVSGDISGGNIVLRLMYRTASASNRVLTASDPPLHFSAKNLGPAM